MLDEIITVIFSSAGLTGSVFAAIMVSAMKKAKKDAEKKREERLRLEILRLEGEERLSALLFAIIRYSKGSCGIHELDDAEKAYNEYLEKSNKVKNEIIGNTFN